MKKTVTEEPPFAGGFCPKKAQEIIDGQVRFYGIKADYRFKDSQGRALIDRREIWVCRPTTPANFIVCLHEIGHVVRGKVRGPVFQDEYETEMYALAEATRYGMPTEHLEKYTTRARAYVIKKLRRALKRGFQLEKVPAHIKAFLLGGLAGYTKNRVATVEFIYGPYEGVKGGWVKTTVVNEATVVPMEPKPAPVAQAAKAPATALLKTCQPVKEFHRQFKMEAFPVAGTRNRLQVYDEEGKYLCTFYYNPEKPGSLEDCLVRAKDTIEREIQVRLKTFKRLLDYAKEQPKTYRTMGYTTAELEAKYRKLRTL